MTTAAQVITELRALGDAQKATEMATSLRGAPRECLGVPAAALDERARASRHALDLDARCGLAQDLWTSGVHEGCIFAAKLLTQARIRPDDTRVWEMIALWVQEADTVAIADPLAVAGGKRLQADTTRLDEVESWVRSTNVLTRRAVLGMTLPFARLAFPKAAETVGQERVLGWAATLVADRDRLIQLAIGGWLRELSRHDSDRVERFLAKEGAGLTRAAHQEARRHLGRDAR